jgi:hypothetical protein
VESGSEQTAAALAFRQLGGLGVLRDVDRERRGGGEDPWLCGPGFRRVCLCRGMVEPELSRGTGTVKRPAPRGSVRVSSGHVWSHRQQQEPSQLQAPSWDWCNSPQFTALTQCRPGMMEEPNGRPRRGLPAGVLFHCVPTERATYLNRACPSLRPSPITGCHHTVCRSRTSGYPRSYASAAQTFSVRPVTLMSVSSPSGENSPTIFPQWIESKKSWGPGAMTVSEPSGWKMRRVGPEML